MKYLIPVAAALSLSACVAQDAQMERGVGFGDHTLYQQQEAYLARARATAAAPAPGPMAAQTGQAPYQSAAAPTAEPWGMAAAAPVMAAAVPPGTSPGTTPGTTPAGSALAADTLAALGAPAPQSGPSSVTAEPLRQVEVAAMPVAALGAQSLSSASGPAPMAAAPAVAPGPATVAAPPRTGGANVVAFALSTSHPAGQKMYRRVNPLGASMTARACARYPSPGMAQEAFLSRGGPERDPLGLDPDGDGYACGWDPTPFRNIRG